MATTTASLADQAIITGLELLRAAAEHKGLTLARWVTETSSVISTESLGKVVLEGKVLDTLEAWGIRQYPHSKHMITFNDDGRQEPIPDFRPSNYWNFNTEKGPPTVTVSFRMGLRPKEGIALYPSVSSESGVGACDHLPNSRFFMAIRQFLESPPAVVQEIKKDDDVFFVSWNDLGLGNLMEIEQLFRKFAQDRAAIKSLGWDGHIFNPPVRLPGLYTPDRFIPEGKQDEILISWRFQLDRYIASISF